MLHIVAACVLAALAGYLLGSIMTSIVVSRLMFHEDVRTHGSGNAGMTNVLRTYGKLPAVLTIVGDVGKSVIAANLGRILFATLIGTDALLCISPIVCVVLLLVFLVQFAFSRIVSLGSIMVAALFPVVTLIYWVMMGVNAPTIIFNTLCSVIMGTMVIWLHRANIERLKNGTEYRFGEKKKQEK